MRILVVGAGIAGLGTARALRQRGLAAEVVEREPAWPHTGAGIYLPGNAARALRALGLEAAVAERGSLITHQRFCDHRGHLLADIDLAALWGDVGHCLALHRADLHEVLASHGDRVPARLGLSVRRRRRFGTRRMPSLRARHRAGDGEIPGSAPSAHAMGSRPDAPPGSHPQPATRPPQRCAAADGDGASSTPTTARSPLMLRHYPAAQVHTSREHVTANEHF